MFCKKVVLKNFANINEKHLRQSFFFNKAQALLTTLSKKVLWHTWFPVNIAKIVRRPFFIEHLHTTAYEDVRTKVFGRLGLNLLYQKKTKSAVTERNSLTSKLLSSDSRLQQNLSQPAFTCSKLTLEQGVKYIQS